MQGFMSNPTAMADRRVLIVALFLGAVAAGLAVAFLASVDGGGDTPAAATVTRSVVVAAEEIEVGERITASMLELRELPVTAIISGAAEELDQVVGETARFPISRGEQVNAVRLVAPPEVQSLSFQIPEGLRGFTIPVSVNESPAALLAPGDFVDVLVAGDAATLVTQDTVIYGNGVAVLRNGLGTDVQAVTTLLQNVQVLSVEREYVENGVPYDQSVRGTPPDDAAVGYVTLALTPEEAQLLWLASQDGELTLTLRAFGDNAVESIGEPSTAVRSRP
jgi:pilus assembly protein CpaB